ncbi:ABC transporter permease [Streptomyces sp. NPDC093707]|uniref:ABC transporter permease n=1 Tax=Streptomyces sp. NPDC093707 TaxID=3154984 RepID=UPI00344E3A64
MNLFKRAWWRLTAQLGKTLMLTGLFFVVCTLVLSGFLVQSAADRAAADAKKKVGAVATMQMDINALMEKRGLEGGGQQGLKIDSSDELRTGPVDKLGTSPVVHRYSYLIEAAALERGKFKLYRAAPPPPGTDTEQGDFFKPEGVPDTEALPAFRNGTHKIISGRGIGPDTEGKVAVLEKRLAEQNGVKVGDKITVGSFRGDIQGSKAVELTVGGIFEDETPSSRDRYTPALSDPGNRFYVSSDAAAALNNEKPGAVGTSVREATFTLGGPEDLAQLKKDAKAAGLDPEIYPLKLNDKQYQALVGPISKTAGFATLTVWLVSIAGVAVLGLIVANALRERRRELGILLAIGEKKSKLLGQHLVETVACALIAIGLAVPASQALAQTAGNSLLAGEVSSAQNDGDSGEPDYANSMGGEKEPKPEADPIDRIDVKLTASDVAKVGATGLGIATLATLIPGLRTLRLEPREILTKGE